MGVVAKLLGFGGSDSGGKQLYSNAKSYNEQQQEKLDMVKAKFRSINETGRGSLITSKNVIDDAKTSKTTLGGYG